jgi:hypothetical protein
VVGFPLVSILIFFLLFLKCPFFVCGPTI